MSSAAEWLARPACDIADAVHRREVGPSALVEASLARIAATDARVNAFTDLTAERARSEAASLERRLASGDAAAQALPLLGVPFAVKP